MRDDWDWLGGSDWLGLRGSDDLRFLRCRRWLNGSRLGGWSRRFNRGTRNTSRNQSRFEGRAGPEHPYLESKSSFRFKLPNCMPKRDADVSMPPKLGTTEPVIALPKLKPPKTVVGRPPPGMTTGASDVLYLADARWEAKRGVDGFGVEGLATGAGAGAGAGVGTADNPGGGAMGVGSTGSGTGSGFSTTGGSTTTGSGSGA